MKKFIVRVRAYRYGQTQWEQDYILAAKNKSEAKKVARGLENSTEFSMDITPVADLRTLKESR
jgi:hypothetical protein